MKNQFPLFLATILLTGCDFSNFISIKDSATTSDKTNNDNINKDENNNWQHEDLIISYNDYGAFLGRSENNTEGFENYNYISLELDEFSDEKIQQLNNKNKKVFAYLNVGSLENYRSYYNDFKNITIGEYENWEDESWIDVSNTNWQNYVVNTIAKSFKNRGVFGVYMDNVDVYTVAKENNLNYSQYAIGLKNIIKGVADLGLKVMINGGSEFLDDMNDKNDSIFNSIWGYHQEEVFSLIEDYDKNIFGKQTEEDKNYYLEITKLMKDKNKNVFLLEYTKDDVLKETIKVACEMNNYHFYIADSINLD